MRASTRILILSVAIAGFLLTAVVRAATAPPSPSAASSVPPWTRAASRQRAKALKECIRHTENNPPPSRTGANPYDKFGFSFQRQPGETARHWCIRHLRQVQAEKKDAEAQKRASAEARIRMALNRKYKQAIRLAANVWKNHHAEFTKRVCGDAYDAALLAATDMRNGMSFTASMADVQKYLSSVTYIDPANAGTAPDDLAAAHANSAAVAAATASDPWNYDLNDPLHRRDYGFIERAIMVKAAKAAWFGEAQDPTRRPAVVAAIEKKKCRLPPRVAE